MGKFHKITGSSVCTFQFEHSFRLFGCHFRRSHFVSVVLFMIVISYHLFFRQHIHHPTIMVLTTTLATTTITMLSTIVAVDTVVDTIAGVHRSHTIITIIIIEQTVDTIMDQESIRTRTLTPVITTAITIIIDTLPIRVLLDFHRTEISIENYEENQKTYFPLIGATF